MSGHHYNIEVKLPSLLSAPVSSTNCGILGVEMGSLSPQGTDDLVSGTPEFLWRQKWWKVITSDAPSSPHRRPGWAPSPDLDDSGRVEGTPRDPPPSRHGETLLGTARSDVKCAHLVVDGILNVKVFHSWGIADTGLSQTRPPVRDAGVRPSTGSASPGSLTRTPLTGPPAP